MPQSRFAQFFAMICAGVSLPASADAGNTSQASAQMPVSLVVRPACSVNATPIDFGTMDSDSGRDREAAATIDVSCTQPTEFAVALDGGQHFQGARRMASADGRSFVAYELYMDAAHSALWNAGQIGSTGQSTDARGSKALAVYGTISAETPLDAGDFGDIVTITLHF